MLSKLKVIPEALLTVTTNVGHYEAMDKTDRYIVWAEDSEGSSVEGDNRKTLQTVQGTIDYYTRSLQIHPGNAEVIYKLGLAYEAAGDKDKMREEADSSIMNGSGRWRRWQRSAFPGLMNTQRF